MLRRKTNAIPQNIKEDPYYEEETYDFTYEQLLIQSRMAARNKIRNLYIVLKVI